MCDLSAYVDFSALNTYAEKVTNMKATEALPQGYFLEAMGIHARADILMANASGEKKERILSECNRLTHPD
jgi:SAM-dependent MidA family methyltransferase